MTAFLVICTVLIGILFGVFIALSFPNLYQYAYNVFPQIDLVFSNSNIHMSVGLAFIAILIFLSFRISIRRFKKKIMQYDGDLLCQKRDEATTKLVDSISSLQDTVDSLKTVINGSSSKTDIVKACTILEKILSSTQKIESGFEIIKASSLK